MYFFILLDNYSSSSFVVGVVAGMGWGGLGFTLFAYRNFYANTVNINMYQKPLKLEMDLFKYIVIRMDRSTCQKCVTLLPSLTPEATIILCYMC